MTAVEALYLLRLQYPMNQPRTGQGKVRFDYSAGGQSGVQILVFFAAVLSPFR